MDLENIMTLLIGTAETKVKPSELIEACIKFKMQQIEYFNINGDTLFNIGYNFVFKTERGEEVRLEFIEVDNNLLQSGFQIIYKSRILFQTIKTDFPYLCNVLKNYYVNEQIQNYHGRN